ncbi:hypothetical protein CAPTEDRAFT_186568 [Capitella teleta]|uniref:Uncharacterized protein n=1 Tax=Capitella teleta TaxID=283909 RepID=R7U7H0_CAPTE|nr:hypothetical protein CAPTEDRAFT_186568 [Capitella teleta]|eukprot:ELT99621.1 hypothetical protein CAPTEDRAFT_186568 [Capitella teleta]
MRACNRYKYTHTWLNQLIDQDSPVFLLERGEKRFITECLQHNTNAWRPFVGDISTVIIPSEKITLPEFGIVCTFGDISRRVKKDFTRAQRRRSEAEFQAVPGEPAVALDHSHCAMKPPRSCMTGQYVLFDPCPSGFKGRHRTLARRQAALPHVVQILIGFRGSGRFHGSIHRSPTRHARYLTCAIIRELGAFLFQVIFHSWPSEV